MFVWIGEDAPGVAQDEKGAKKVKSFFLLNFRLKTEPKNRKQMS